MSCTDSWRGLYSRPQSTRLTKKRRAPWTRVGCWSGCCRKQKDFLGPLFKKLGNHSSFYEWNLGSNRSPKWRKLDLTLFRSLRELRASFHFSGGTTVIKAWNVGREGHQLFQTIMRKDYLWRRKKCSQNIWTVSHSRDNLGLL